PVSRTVSKPCRKTICSFARLMRQGGLAGTCSSNPQSGLANDKNALPVHFLPGVLAQTDGAPAPAEKPSLRPPARISSDLLRQQLRGSGLRDRYLFPRGLRNADTDWAAVVCGPGRLGAHHFGIVFRRDSS